MSRQILLLIGVMFILVLLYLGLRYFLPLVLPFAFGAFLALMLEPAVSFLQNRMRIPRPFAAGITIISAVAISALVLVLLTTSVAVDIKELSYRLPAYSKSMIKMLQDWASETQAFMVVVEPLYRRLKKSLCDCIILLERCLKVAKLS